MKKKYLFATVVFGILLVSFVLTRLNSETKTFNSRASEIQIPTVVTVSPSPSPTVTLTPTPTVRPIYIGMWTQGFWDDSAKTLHPEALQTLEQKLDKKFAIAHYYRGWDALQSETIVNELTSISAAGWRPMLSVNPYYFSDCTSEGKSIYKTIADGHCDDFLHRAGKNLKNFGKPLFFRFAWEMNLTSLEWGLRRTNSTAQEYIAAWRHIHEIFAAEGAQNALWVFSPNAITPDSVSYNELYPGDLYVDWIAIDVYNVSSTIPGNTWQTFTQLFRSSYNQLTAIAPLKPLMIAETNTTNVGGNKPLWYKSLLQTEIPYSFPRVKAVIFYNEDRTVKENVNWLIDIDAASLTAFKQGIAPSFYKSSY